MGIKKTLTPKDTKEIKPNLFIQKTKYGYRQINPMAWNGKLRVREQLRTVFCLRTIFTIALIIFIVWSYMHDTKECRELMEEFEDDPAAFAIKYATPTIECTEQQEKNNICTRERDDNYTINLSSYNG